MNDFQLKLTTRTYITWHA